MKKIVSLILCMMMIFTSVAVPSSAAKTNEPTTEELERIIKTVRPKIDVPEEYTEFEWHYSAPSYYSRASWSLSWNTKNYDGHVSVTTDADGNIKSFDTYSNKTDRTPTLPEKSPEEFLDTAKAFIEKTAPYTNGKLVFKEARVNSLRNHSYIYGFERVENGIVVPDNGATLTLDYTTGKVTSFNCTFDIDASFDKKDNLITEEKAKEILSTKQNMVLSYRLKTEWDNETNTIKERRAYLVYSPEISYLSVDAVTGEIYTERNTWTVNKFGTLTGGSVNSAMKDMVTEDAKQESAEGEYRLSESELKQLEVLEGLISRDEAIKSVTSNSALYINEKANAVDARLRKNNIYGEKTEEQSYIWDISFSNPSDEKYGWYDSMSATVDAKTGELLSFSAELPNYYYYKETETDIPEIKYTKEQGKEIADAFLKVESAEKIDLVRYTEDSGYAVPINYIEKATGTDGEFINEPVYRTVQNRYVRVNEGVDFIHNSIYAQVDLVTGKITSFSENWYDDVVFESPKDAITPKEALIKLYSYDGFGVNYEINSNFIYNEYLAKEKGGETVDYDALYEKNIVTRIVFSCYAPATTLIDAITGNQIDYSGEDYVPDSNYEYSDIEGHWAESLITRFAYASIGFRGGKFLPDEAITAEEFTELLSKCGIYGYDEKFDNSAKSISRTDAVKYIINYLGYEKIAQLENVFITDFADNTALKSEDVGYIAIARGFGIVNGDGDSFRPYDTLTRAEALSICSNVISSKAAA